MSADAPQSIVVVIVGDGQCVFIVIKKKYCGEMHDALWLKAMCRMAAPNKKTINTMSAETPQSIVVVVVGDGQCQLIQRVLPLTVCTTTQGSVLLYWVGVGAVQLL